MGSEMCIRDRYESWGYMVIGVCNEANTCAWGVYLFHARLFCYSRDANGQLTGAPPPEGWPDGNRTQVMVDEAGRPADLRKSGAVIEVVVDHSDGSLAFGVNGAPPRRVPNVWPPGYDAWDHRGEEGHVPPAKVPFKFPLGAQFRPLAVLLDKYDRMSFARPYL